MARIRNRWFANGLSIGVAHMLCVGLAVASESGLPTPKTAFTVADSVGMVRIADPDLSFTALYGVRVKAAPDNRRSFIVTSRGDLGTGQRIFELRLFETESVKAFLKRGGGDVAALSRVVATFACELDDPCIGQSRWVAPGRIAFIGQSGVAPAQAFMVDVETGAQRQLTNSPTAVAQFDVSSDGRSIAYYASVDRSEDWHRRARDGIVVEEETLGDLATDGKRGMRTWYQLFLSADGAAPRKADMPVLKEAQGATVLKLAVSPNGRRVITEAEVSRMPRRWLGFDQQRDNNVKKALIKDLSEELLASHYRSTQFVVVDMGSGATRPLLDAPSETFGAGVAWVDDSHAVLLNTHAPAAATIGAVTKGLAVVDVAVDTGRARVVHDLAAGSTGRQRRLSSFSWNPGQKILQFDTRGGGAEGRTCHAYQRAAQQWRIDSCGPEAGGLEFVISQAPDRAPELAVQDGSAREAVAITDLNPMFRARTFGRVEVFDSKDRTGRAWRGHLIRPTDYAQGRRYPLVIQTHGFDPAAFLVDGPNDAANGFAAQALANLGFVVLQFNDFASDVANTPLEMDLAVGAYEAAIDRLDEAGLVDRTKVALTAWSRTGFYVEHALLHSKVRYAAVSLSDTSSLTFSRYLVFHNFYAAYNANQEAFLGGPPWDAAGLERWRSRSTTFNYPKINSAVRIEGVSDLYGSWELLAGLRSNRKPAEFVWFPESSHLIVRPRHRYRSQQGAIDWYRFWLQDVERKVATPGTDETPESLADQYRRWRAMRAEANSPPNTAP